MKTIRITALPLAFLLAMQLNVMPALAERGNPGDSASGIQLAEGSNHAARSVP